ncbi:uncharacterized protein B0H18DRAFT_1001264 [Fomitopsis serialis]|uniref:uncharacterized protein n=1 Tax=Fomitopsis serialis TaxID=139415 RepID=UPI002007FB9B|nr:uncharacterized protein B0H18DRAFT_1001264 [Neoantrodia serialis]KAH9928069.1 hypothetical protein B0H18DRAFT_1001264 [Neoantrodia serialis]
MKIMHTKPFPIALRIPGRRRDKYKPGAYSCLCPSAAVSSKCHSLSSLIIQQSTSTLALVVPMFSIRLFVADHPHGTSMVDMVKEMARKPMPRYLECRPATFAQPTPCDPRLEGRAKFAAILNGEWSGEEEAQAASRHHIAVDESRQSEDIVYTTWPPVLTTQTSPKLGQSMPPTCTHLPGGQNNGAPEMAQRQYNERKRIFHRAEKLVTARLLANEAAGDTLLQEIMDLTLAAAAEDAALESTVPTHPRMESAPIVPSPQTNTSNRDLAPWERRVPHPLDSSPASSTTLLSPIDAWEPLATSTPRPDNQRGSLKEHATQ